MIPRDTITVDLAVPDGDPEMLRAAARRLRQVADHGLATAGVRGGASAELAGVWSGPSAAADEHRRALATIELTHAIDPVLHAVASARADQLRDTELTGIHRRYGAAMDTLTAAGTRCARALAGLTPNVTSPSPIATAPSLDPDLVHDLPLVRGQLDAAAAAGVGRVAPREESSWFDSTVAAAGTAGAWAYNHTAVPLVNGATDVAQAAAQHPEDLAQLALGAGMMVLGASGEVGGVALDATGVGAVAGVPLNVVAAGAIAGGATAAGIGAGNLIQHARANDNRLLQEADPPNPGRGEAGDPLPNSMRPDAAGSTWEGRVARNRKGDVWQAPDKMNPGRGGPDNRDCLRIGDPKPCYPDGYVRFYNSEGQPIRANGKPGRDRHDETHFKIRPDGTFSLPQGWNP